MRNCLEQALAAGERALGERAFVEDVGRFWGLLETRPYMRARISLADCLWHMGDRQAAVEHMIDMLRLNPEDNQGIRSMLVPRLLMLDRLVEAEDLLERYREEIFAQWCFDHALLLYLKEGATSTAARTALEKAFETNPYVADYLLRKKKIPKSIPDEYTLHSKEEACLYVLYADTTWSSKIGALVWLRKTVAASKSRAPEYDETPRISGNSQ